MRRRLLTLAALTALSACSITAPISGQTDEGLPVTGVAVADMSGDGQVTVAMPDRECQGSYNAISEAPALTVPIVCDDGVRGAAQVDRSADLLSGDGRFELDDGTSGEFRYEVE